MNKESKHILGKIEPKEIMAHPKDKISKLPYVKHDCIKCEKEYLSQGILQHEQDFCPKHTDLRFCEECCEVFPKAECKESDDGLWYCKEDFTYKCRECGEPMEEDLRYCSKQCHNEYMADLMEDENKDRK